MRCVLYANENPFCIDAFGVPRNPQPSFFRASLACLTNLGAFYTRDPLAFDSLKTAKFMSSQRTMSRKNSVIIPQGLLFYTIRTGYYLILLPYVPEMKKKFLWTVFVHIFIQTWNLLVIRIRYKFYTELQTDSKHLYDKKLEGPHMKMFLEEKNPVTMFENRPKSRIQHCERSELRLYFSGQKN